MTTEPTTSTKVDELSSHVGDGNAEGDVVLEEGRISGNSERGSRPDRQSKTTSVQTHSARSSHLQLEDGMVQIEDTETQSSDTRQRDSNPVTLVGLPTPQSFSSAKLDSSTAPQDGRTDVEHMDPPPEYIIRTKDLGFLPIPTRLRHDPSSPYVYKQLLGIIFGIGSTFTVMNLYYCQPLLVEFTKTFNVTDKEVSLIPTLVQAGYASGLLLITPLGDLVRRRPLLLILITLSASVALILAITTSLKVFQAFSFILGLVSVTPQVLIPFAADLAPPHRRASTIAIVLSGLLFGILLARVLAGVIGQVTTWRVVYFMAVGLQVGIWFVMWAFVPDVPAKNSPLPSSRGTRTGSGGTQGGKKLTYIGILWSMAKYAVTEPTLIQACLIQCAGSACFSNFWVTLTFLLSEEPYRYSTLAIGLFGLIGIFGVSMAPFVGRLIDNLIPWYATLVATLIVLVFGSVQLAGAGLNISAVVLACLGLDVGRQMQQVSLTTRVYAVEESARARLNAVLILSNFVGQVMGTATGTSVFLKSGWRAAAGLNMAWYAWQLFALLMRGPHSRRYDWVGWHGGWEPRKNVVEARMKNPDRKSSDPGDVEEKGVPEKSEEGKA